MPFHVSLAVVLEQGDVGGFTLNRTHDVEVLLTVDGGALRRDVGLDALPQKDAERIVFANTLPDDVGVTVGGRQVEITQPVYLQTPGSKEGGVAFGDLLPEGLEHPVLGMSQVETEEDQ